VLDRHVDAGGQCIPCICPFGQYESCLQAFPSGMPLIAGLVSATFEWMSNIALGVTGDGELVYGVPDLINLSVHINLNFAGLPIINETVRLVNLFPLLEQFLRLGLDANGHSTARGAFPGGPPVPPDVTTAAIVISISAFCVVMRLPSVLKDAVIIVLWVTVVLAAYSLTFLFIFAVPTIAYAVLAGPLPILGAMFTAFTFASLGPADPGMLTLTEYETQQSLAAEDEAYAAADARAAVGTGTSSGTITRVRHGDGMSTETVRMHGMKTQDRRRKDATEAAVLMTWTHDSSRRPLEAPGGAEGAEEEMVGGEREDTAGGELWGDPASGNPATVTLSSVGSFEWWNIFKTGRLHAGIGIADSVQAGELGCTLYQPCLGVGSHSNAVELPLRTGRDFV
jgi:hypothetical protein